MPRYWSDGRGGVGMGRRQQGLGWELGWGTGGGGGGACATLNSTLPERPERSQSAHGKIGFFGKPVYRAVNRFFRKLVLATSRLKTLVSGRGSVLRVRSWCEGWRWWGAMGGVRMHVAGGSGNNLGIALHIVSSSIDFQMEIPE